MQLDTHLADDILDRLDIIIWMSPNFEVVRSPDGDLTVSARLAGKWTPLPPLAAETSAAVVAALVQPRTGSVQDNGLARDREVARILNQRQHLSPFPHLFLDTQSFKRQEKHLPRDWELRQWRVMAEGMTSTGLESGYYTMQRAFSDVLARTTAMAAADGIEITRAWLDGWSPIVSPTSRWVKASAEIADIEDFESALVVARRAFPEITGDIPVHGDLLDVSHLDWQGTPRKIAADFQQVICDLADRFDKTLRAEPVSSRDNDSIAWRGHLGFGMGSGHMIRVPRQHAPESEKFQVPTVMLPP